MHLGDLDVVRARAGIRGTDGVLAGQEPGHLPRAGAAAQADLLAAPLELEAVRS